MYICPSERRQTICKGMGLCQYFFGKPVHLVHPGETVITRADIYVRVLEYYHGILFLTTNRVGVLDEAIKSRIHISLFYPHLSREHIWTITQMNLERLRKIDAYRSRITGQKPLQFMDEEICDELSKYGTREHEQSLNGRQIRNAVHSAACLAWYEQKLKEERGEAAQTFWLSVEHFKTVKQTMILHEEYLNRTKGMSDADMANYRGERHDKFRTRGNSQTSGGLGMHQHPGSQYSLCRSDSGASMQTQSPQTGRSSWSQPAPRQNSYGFQSTPPTGPRGETSAFMSSAGSPGQQYHAVGPTSEFSPST